jgi:hypothetical protein
MPVGEHPKNRIGGINKNRSILYIAFSMLYLLVTQVELRAQNSFLEARVNTVAGDVQLLRSAPLAMRRNISLIPGDVILTGVNGRVVISLSDGSQITVLPNSRVVLKNYRAANSVRELLEITIGRVRVKIHRLGGKPNPYLLNSPAASIAVRGTEFIVDVQQSGETMVAVSEGLVEVISHANANNKRLVTPGGSVIVRPGGEISLAVPGPGGGLNGRASPASKSLDPVQGLAAAYQRSVDGLAQNSVEMHPSLFAAFPDPHLDSLDNPAYAAEFKQAQGRLLLLPSISETDRSRVIRGLGGQIPVFPEKGEPHRFDYTFTPQLTFFTPAPNSRLTFGAGISAVRTGLHALTLYQAPEDVLAKLIGNRTDTDGGAASMTAINSAFIAARRFGEHGRTSLGIELEYLSGDGSFLNIYRVSEAQVSGGSGVESKTQLARTRLTLGFAREFEGGRKLGLFFRHGLTSVDQQNKLRVLSNNELIPFDTTIISTHGSEIGARWRSPLTRRLFYGVEASYLDEHIDSRRVFVDKPALSDRDHARRLRFGGGIGYALRPNTIFSLDLAGGYYHTSKPSVLIPTSNIRFQSERSNFFSTHAATQTDIWKRIFASVSFLAVRRKNAFELDGPPPILFNGNEYLQPPYRHSFTDLFSNLGGGWKFKPNIIVQYLFSTDHSRRGPNHSLMFRYTFDLKISGEK